eukprot:TRINITY_DN25132_c0_g1_i1.p1 TRINITY_DN25132_c0_g1~~TRINITY_DN25132_c0_g1_i1.p1  ORF type:complete len:393 (+),score=106.92 TRINITY_DN25132_c0_g1_i1:79-1179(+)
MDRDSRLRNFRSEKLSFGVRPRTAPRNPRARRFQPSRVASSGGGTPRFCRDGTGDLPSSRRPKTSVATARPPRRSVTPRSTYNVFQRLGTSSLKESSVRAATYGSASPRLFTVDEGEGHKSFLGLSSFRSGALGLEVKLSERLNRLEMMQEAEQYYDKNAMIEIFRELFEEVIELDKPFSLLLRKIKTAYESINIPREDGGIHAAYDMLLKEYSRLRVRLADVEKKFEQEKNEVHILKEQNAYMQGLLDIKEKESRTLSKRYFSTAESFIQQKKLFQRIVDVEEDVEMSLLSEGHREKEKHTLSKGSSVSVLEREVEECRHQIGIIRLEEGKALQRLERLETELFMRKRGEDERLPVDVKDEEDLT